jgi:hypothetical protein
MSQSKYSYLQETYLEAKRYGGDIELLLSEWILKVAYESNPSPKKLNTVRPDLVARNQKASILNKGEVWLLWTILRQDNPRLKKQVIDLITAEKINAALANEGIEEISEQAVRKIRLDWEKAIRKSENPWKNLPDK